MPLLVGQLIAAIVTEGEYALLTLESSAQCVRFFNFYYVAQALQLACCLLVSFGPPLCLCVCVCR